MWINGVDKGSLLNLSGGNDISLFKNDLNIDFVQGDKIRLRAGSIGGIIEDTVVKLITKWRG